MTTFNMTEYEAAMAAQLKATCVATGSSPDADSYYSANDQFFLVIMGALVFFMQAGFAALEAGSTGVTSVTSILFKNVCDVMIGSIAWWSIGYAFAYGDDFGNKFIGGTNFFLMDVGLCDYANYFYQWTFAATAVTIVSGAMAGRTQLKAYIVYSIFITGFVYPVVVHWTWSGSGWLSEGSDGIGYSDFAGSGIVHCVGGMAALVGAIFVGPRGTEEFENVTNKADIPGHSMPLVALGTFILFFGFIGFNGGSVLAFNSAEDTTIMSLAVVNTVMAAAGGGITAEVINWLVLKRKHWSLMQMCNGTIAGMVAICASANDVWPWAAVVIGIVGGASYKLWSHALIRLKIDDAIDACPVHLGAGLWGVIAAPLFARDRCPYGSADCDTTDLAGKSVFYDGQQSEAYTRLGWNVAGCLVICLWTGGLCSILFFILNKLGWLRVADSVIDGKGGLDYHEHNELAYVGLGNVTAFKRPSMVAGLDQGTKQDIEASFFPTQVAAL